MSDEKPCYFVDDLGSLWKGPIRVDNFNYSRFHGIGYDGKYRWFIWVAERSDPDEKWIQLPANPLNSCVVIQV